MEQKGKTLPGGIRVLVIDDSPLFREVLKELLQGIDAVAEVRTAGDGEAAIRMVLTDPPDVITLDLNMPGINGFTFLRWLMKNRPLPVVVVSSEGSEKTVFKALDLGALDFVVKTVGHPSSALPGFREELGEKIKAVAGKDLSQFPAGAPAGGGPDGKYLPVPELPSGFSREGLLVIGASTGGPAAVQRVLKDLPGGYPFPVIVVQHMPPVFTQQFAQRLERNTSLLCREARDMDRLLPGRILVVPGGFHLSVRGELSRYVRIVPKQEGDRYVPSVDITMESAGRCYGPCAIGVLLTGMGNDGAQGLMTIKNGGGFTIAESEESAVVFGMPRAAVQLGAAYEVLPVDRIAAKILECTGTLTGLKIANGDDKR